MGCCRLWPVSLTLESLARGGPHGSLPSVHLFAVLTCMLLPGREGLRMPGAVEHVVDKHMSGGERDRLSRKL